MAKITPIGETPNTFPAEMKETFWGRSVWPDQAGMAALLRAAVAGGGATAFRVPSATQRRQGRRRVYPAMATTSGIL